jgi:excisionase family DNA binding protein
MGIARRTVDNWLQRGLPHLKLGSRRVRFDLREVDEWFRTHCRVVRRGKLNADDR